MKQKTKQQLLCEDCKKKVRKWDKEYQRQRRLKLKEFLKSVGKKNIKINKVKK